MKPKNESPITPENPSFEEDKIETAINYLQKHGEQEQLDDAAASEQELPIGSGEVESAHRHILQKHSKIPGAWWRLARAEEMAQTRVLRASQRWNEFWEEKVARPPLPVTPPISAHLFWGGYF